MTPENPTFIQGNPDYYQCMPLEISAKRAISNAQQKGNKRNGEIGFSDLYEGVVEELGSHVVNSDLYSRCVTPFRVERVSDALRASGDGSKPVKEGSTILSERADDVMTHAGKRSRLRRSHSQRINARDLLHGIAIVAIEEGDIFEI